nr:tetratricopeptide repeat protein [Chloroflexus aurantiacus]
MSATDVALDTCTTCGEALRLLRRRARLSQRELSIATGYSESHISRIENNERPLDRHSLLALFVPALQLQAEPETVARWLALCTSTPSSRSESARSTESTFAESPAYSPTPALPLQLTSFIGRIEEVSEVCTLLQRPDVRLLSFTGIGGCGKTRLALRVAEMVAPGYAHGVHWVELAALEQPHVLPQLMLERWQLRCGATDHPLDVLSNFVSNRRMLLVLDNCEHLIEAVATLVLKLLQRCPSLQILATSREILSVPGEVHYHVQPLSLPPVWRSSSPSATEIMRYEAIQLFVARSQAVFPAFTLTDTNAAAVAAICQRLDGIPLGIELAAAWMSTLAPQQLAEHLQMDFSLLVDQRRSVLPRHQTLRAAIEWSYRLLTDPERTLLRYLAVLRGTWSLAIAEAIAGEAGFSATHQLLYILNRLVSKSLITVDHRNEGEAWYRLLEPLREYLLTMLSEEEEARIQQHRLRYYAHLVETAEAGLSGALQQSWLDRMEREHDNLRAALSWGCDHAGVPAQLAALLASRIWRFWLVRGYYCEGRRWLEEMLTRTAPSGQVRIRLLYGAGVLARLQLDLDAAARFAGEQLQLAAELNDLRGLADGYGVMGWIEAFQGNLQEATRFFEQRLLISRQLNYQRGIAYALRGLGESATAQANYREAGAYLQEALSIFTELGDRRYIAQIWRDFGRLAYHEDDLESAITAFQSSLAIYQEVADAHSVAELLLDLSRLALANHDLAAAVAHQAAADRLIEDTIDRQLRCASDLNRARIALHQQDVPAAREYLKEALQILAVLHDRPAMITGIELSAAVALAMQEPVHALCLWSAARRFRQGSGLWAPRFESRWTQQEIDTLRLRMPPDDFSAFWQIGQVWPLEQAVTQAHILLVGRS